MPTVDGYPDDRILRGVDEPLVHIRAVDPRPPDRPAPVVRPVDVAAVHRDAGRCLPGRDETAVGTRAVELGPPDDAAPLVLSAVRALSPEDEPVGGREWPPPHAARAAHRATATAATHAPRDHALTGSP